MKLHMWQAMYRRHPSWLRYPLRELDLDGRSLSLGRPYSQTNYARLPFSIMLAYSPGRIVWRKSPQRSSMQLTRLSVNNLFMGMHLGPLTMRSRWVSWSHITGVVRWTRSSSTALLTHMTSIDHECLKESGDDFSWHLSWPLRCSGAQEEAP